MQKPSILQLWNPDDNTLQYRMQVDPTMVQINSLLPVSLDNSFACQQVFATSDKRKKTDIKLLEHDSSKIHQLEPKQYRWKSDDKKETQIGFIAQDLQTVYPALVKENPKGDLSVDYNGLIAVLVNHIKDQETRISRLEEKLH